MALPTFAGRYEYTGKIKEIVSVHNNTGALNDNLATIMIDGFASAGSCRIGQTTNLVSARILDNEQGKLHMSMALMAYASGSKVRVRVDDINKNSSDVCYLELIRLNTDY